MDHAATTPLHPEVLEAMLPYFGLNFGNPSSLHSYGRRARQAITEARDQIAVLLGCSPKQLVFTSGGTESDNLAILGSLDAVNPHGKSHMITTQIEHQAVLSACGHLESRGYEVTYLPVDSYGRVSTRDLLAALRPTTALVSVMYGNNEVGTIQPIDEIGAICREHDILLHVDAVQALGIIPMNLSVLPVDLVSFSAHKINGPKGCGLLYYANGIPLNPQLYGGNQERSKRAGTENVAAIVGFAKAIQLATDSQVVKQQHIAELRELFVTSLISEIGKDGFEINGHPEHYLPHILNLSFTGLDKAILLMKLDLVGIAASAGSACTSGALEDSHVLIAMGHSSDHVKSSIRFSFGYETTEEIVLDVTQKIGTIVRRLRKTN